LANIIDSGMVTFEEAFLGYALVPMLTAIVAALLWPREVVRSAAVSDSQEEQDSDAKSSALASLPLRSQIATAEFVLVSHTTSVTMVCINFFIATVTDQVGSRPNTSTMLTKAFGILLPLGGLVYIYPIGSLLDNYGVVAGFLALWIAYIVFYLLWTIYQTTGVIAIAYAAFVVFAFCRPLFYTLGATFVGHVFGFQTFGRLYGILVTIAGFANTLVQPLAVLAQLKDFHVANSIALLVQLSTIALPARSNSWAGSNKHVPWNGAPDGAHRPDVSHDAATGAVRPPPP